MVEHQQENMFSQEKLVTGDLHRATDDELARRWIEYNAPHDTDDEAQLDELATAHYERTERLRAALAAYAHDAWSGWMTYQFEKSQRNPDGSITIPVQLVVRWDRQRTTPYSLLPANEQKSDLEEADRILNILRASP